MLLRPAGADIPGLEGNALEYTAFRLLTEAAARWPDRPAYTDDHTTVTFSRLLEMAHAVGTTLLSAVNAPVQPVAVLTRRNVASLVGFFGALARGCYYVPVDCAMPSVRMRALLERLRPQVLLYAPEDAALAEELAQTLACAPVPLALETACATLARPEELAAARAQVLDVDPAYLIFTSGSTGTPKGILVSHGSLLDFIDWYADFTGAGPEDRLGNQAPFFFDLSVKDIYLTLKTGAETVILPKKCFSFPVLLTRALDEHRITTLSWATSAFHLVANSGVLENHPPHYLKRVLLGGEALHARQLNIWRRALPEVQFVNLYGPTEVTVDCTYYPITRSFADDEPVPIGRACPNMQVLLLDEQGRPVPPGEPGEICVRGRGVAIGYFDDPDRTGASFGQNPLNPLYPDRLYHTGDLAVLGEDGNLTFRSRADGQIKHMGYRIELGEIETALSAVEGVQAAVCFFDAPADKLVCVYQGSLDEKALVTALADRLPRYMLPNRWERRQALPYTPGGKIDRTALREEVLS